jgi:hypothetical protein
MPFNRNIDFFKQELAANPSLRSPAWLPELPPLERAREWHVAIRSYDAACLELGVKTPGQIQNENYIFTGFIPRLVRLHATP